MLCRNTLTDSPSIETQHGHPGIVLATLSLANVMALLDLFVVNVALHNISASALSNAQRMALVLR